MGAAPQGNSAIIRYQYRQSADGGGTWETGWTNVPDGADAGTDTADETSYTVTGLANNTTYTYEVRAVNSDGEGATATDRATPMLYPVCSRTQGVQDRILGSVQINVTACDDITTAALAGIRTLGGGASITSLQAGDYAGLTGLRTLLLINSGLTSLPAGIFDDLTALETLNLSFNQLASLPAGIDKLTALTSLNLASNRLTSLADDSLDDLTNLTELKLGNNGLTGLPDGIFDALTALKDLHLNDNSLSTLPDGLFENLTGLRELVLSGNPGSSDFKPTAAAGDDQSVAPGATVTLDGSGSGGAWGSNLTYSWTLDSGTTVTLDSPTGSMPSFTAPSRYGVLVFTLTTTGRGRGFDGQSFTIPFTDTDQITVTVRSNTPRPGAPASLTATGGNTRARLEWAAPDNGGDITHYQYRQSADGGESWSPDWTDIPDGADEDRDAGNETSYTVSNLTDDTTYTYEVRAANGGGEGDAATDAATPMGYPVCDRTEEVKDTIVAAVTDVAACDDVTADDLAAIEILDFNGAEITTLQAGDFAGLTAMHQLILSNNDLTGLPAGIFAGLTALTDLRLSRSNLVSLPANIFDDLTVLYFLDLTHNRLTSLPDGVFENTKALLRLLVGGNPGATDMVRTANAGADQAVQLGARVTLDGSDSGGAWGTNITYRWSQNSDTPVTLNNARAAMPTFTAPNTDEYLLFTLTTTPGPRSVDVVGDGQQPYTDTDQIAVTVGNPTPTLLDAAVNGTSLVMTFTGNLAAASLPNSAFTVKKTPSESSEER